MKAPILVLAALLVAGNSANACQDLSVRFKGKIARVVNNFSTNAGIRTSFVVRNETNDVFDKTIKVTGFLFPRKDIPQSGVFTKRSAVLQTLDIPVKLAAKSEATFIYGIPQGANQPYLPVPLPKMPLDRYVLALYVDSDDQVINECSEYNNVTPTTARAVSMTPNAALCGKLFPTSCLRSDRDHINYDIKTNLYPRFKSKIKMESKGAFHLLHATVEGSSDPINFELRNRSRDYWSAFFALSEDRKNFYILDFDRANNKTQKQYWLVRFPERIRWDGQKIGRDQYGQHAHHSAHAVAKWAGLSPGKYGLFVWLDTHHKVDERDESDDIVGEAFEVMPIRWLVDDTAWYVHTKSKPVSHTTDRQIYFSSGYEENLSWSVSFENAQGRKMNKPNWLEMPVLSGTVTPQYNSVKYKIRSDLVTGTLNEQVRVVFTAKGIHNKGLENHPVRYPIHFAKYADEGPKLEFVGPYGAAYFEQVGMTRGAPEKFVMRNAGTTPIDFRLNQNTNLEISPAFGRIAPSGTVTVTLKAPHQRREEWAKDASLKHIFRNSTLVLHTNTARRSMNISVTHGVRVKPDDYKLGRTYTLGQSCSAGPNTPTLTASNVAIGKTATITGRGFPAFKTVHLYMSPPGSSFKLGNCTIYLARNLEWIGSHSTSFGTWGAGFPIPAERKYLGTRAAIQAYVDNNSSPQFTNGVEVEVGTQ